MKLETNRVKLLEHLAVFATVADKSGIYSCVLIECVSNRLMLACSDGDMTVRQQAECDGDFGTVAVDVRRLQQILAGMSGERVTIETTQACVVIRSENSRAILQDHPSSQHAIGSLVREQTQWWRRRAQRSTRQRM